ncbi:effector-associated constant component EACC1 [Actinomadura meridiana]
MADLCRHLSAHGFVVDDQAENARSVLTETIIATASNPGAWTALGATIVAYLRRDRGKAARIRVDDSSFSIHGYSAREAERLAAELTELIRAHEEPDDVR